MGELFDEYVEPSEIEEAQHLNDEERKALQIAAMRQVEAEEPEEFRALLEKHRRAKAVERAFFETFKKKMKKDLKKRSQSQTVAQSRFEEKRDEDFGGSIDGGGRRQRRTPENHVNARSSHPRDR